MLKRAQWEKVLRETGFSETTSLPGLTGPTGGEGQIGLLARKSYEELRFQSNAIGEMPEEKSWLVFADASGLGDALASRLREIDARCRVVRPADHFGSMTTTRFSLRPGALEDWQKLIDACTDSPPERIVYLWSLDAQVGRYGGQS